MIFVRLWDDAVSSFQVGISRFILQFGAGMLDYRPTNFHAIRIQFAGPNNFPNLGSRHFWTIFQHLEYFQWFSGFIDFFEICL